MPVLETLFAASDAQTAVDLFTGTTRVAGAMKQVGMYVTAVDTASYSEVFSKTFIELDSSEADLPELEKAVRHLNSLPGSDGYFTEVFCEKARFFQASNGQRIDSIRDAIESEYRDSWMYFPLLSCLLIAADKVDSTTGVQMAYLKNWSRRSFMNLELKVPELIAGKGASVRSDAAEAVTAIGSVDLAYLDPPYNQHRYFGNYHIWETLVRWDKPDYYGIANKRLDARDPENKSAFNSKLTLPSALKNLISNLDAKTLILSYNNESWLSRRELKDMCSGFETVKIIDFDSKRYVGAKIGGYNQAGKLVGTPGVSRNLEHIVIAGSADQVKALTTSLGQ
jgi:adenine-specific DNA-methyltransferase